MAGPEAEQWFDDDAGRLVRPYTVSNGRTRPTTRMELLSMIVATGARPRGHLEPDYQQALELCRSPITVAELSAHLRLPAAIVKVLLSDLVEWGAVNAHAPDHSADQPTASVLEKVLNALQRRV